MSKAEFEVSISKALEKALEAAEEIEQDAEKQNGEKALAVIQNKRKSFPRLMKKYSNGSVIYKILTSNGEVRLSDDILRVKPIDENYEFSKDSQIKGYEVFFEEIEKRGYDIEVELKITEKV
jgi:hypothetical protein